jgi:raffinose/stachyose/melibiose transport system permease protein
MVSEGKVRNELAHRARRKTASAAKWIFLLFLLAFAIVPFLWLIMISFKSHGEFLIHPLKPPTSWKFVNYITAVEMAKMHLLLLNSIIIASFAMILNIAVTSMGAFIITREKLRISGFVSNLILLGVLIPIISFMVPYMGLIRSLRLYNTRAALILTYAAINLPISFFIIKAFMQELPRSLEEAAEIEGASIFQRFTKVILPLSTPGMVTAGTLCFIYSWNEFAYALLLTSSTAVRTVQLGISFFSTQFRSDYPAMYAAIVLTMIPSVIVYIFLHDRIIGGLTAGAVKG